MSGMIVPKIADDLVGVVRLGLVYATPVAVGPSGPALEAEIEATCAALVAAHAGKPPAEIPGLAPARELYKAFGIDPTRTRPSSEALLRRVLQGKGMPRINNVVDICNLCALRFLLSIGLYDAERIEGEVVLRRGRPGEAYQGIRKDVVNLEGRPVLADRVGAFGNPTSDSLRTAVMERTKGIWMVIFASVSCPLPELEGHIREARRLTEAHAATPDTVSSKGSLLQA